jgi:hypothetical protein
MSGAVFSEDGKIDTYTVPTSGTCVITAIGATGGGLGAGYGGGRAPRSRAGSRSLLGTCCTS